jgi:hypothetical protein
MSEEIINFPKLVDSTVSSGIITFNSLENPKQKYVNLTFDFLEPNNKISKLNVGCDYYSVVNLNYKLKSALNNIEESIKNYANK